MLVLVIAIYLIDVLIVQSSLTIAYCVCHDYHRRRLDYCVGCNWRHSCERCYAAIVVDLIVVFTARLSLTKCLQERDDMPRTSVESKA
jgi:hypothetical protein